MWWWSCRREGGAKAAVAIEPAARAGGARRRGLRAADARDTKFRIQDAEQAKPRTRSDGMRPRRSSERMTANIARENRGRVPNFLVPGSVRAVVVDQFAAGFRSDA